MANRLSMRYSLLKPSNASHYKQKKKRLLNCEHAKNPVKLSGLYFTSRLWFALCATIEFSRIQSLCVALLIPVAMNKYRVVLVFFFFSHKLKLLSSKVYLVHHAITRSLP